MSLIEIQLLRNGYFVFYLRKAQTKTDSDVWIEGSNYHLYSKPSYKRENKITVKDNLFPQIKEFISRNDCPFDVKHRQDLIISEKSDCLNRTIRKEQLVIGRREYRLSVLIVAGATKREMEVLAWLDNHCEMHVCLSLVDYLQAVLENAKVFKKNTYYRGQSSFYESWLPSLFRETKWVDNEVLLNSRVMSRHVDEFSDCKTTIERLIKLKHFNQPSRLLDIVSNPLMALYFACNNEKEKSSGIIATIFSKQENEKYSLISDTVVELSSLSMNNRLPALYSCKRTKDKEIMESQYNEEKKCCNYCVINSFLEEQAHQCKKDMGIESYWDNVSLEKLNQCIVVNPEENNVRIKQQQGLFILCGLNSQNINEPPRTFSRMFMYNRKRYFYFVPKPIVDDCLKALDVLGITKSQVYFDLEKTIEYEKGELLK